MTGRMQIFSGDLYAQDQYPQHQVGQLGEDEYGDLYRYAKVGASNISRGKLQLAPTQKTNHHNNAVAAAAAIGATQVSVTIGATAMVAGEYNNGYLIVNDATGEGQTYRIAQNPAIDSAGTGTIRLERGLVVALTTSSEVTFVHNAWNGVVEGTAVTVRAAGVPLIAGTAGYYLWLKTRGVASVLIGTAATLGADVIVGGTAGAVTDRTDALGASAEPVVGVADVVLGVATEYNPIRLCID